MAYNLGDGGHISTDVLLSAQRLLASGKIDENEYDMLINCDAKFRGETAREDAVKAQSRVENCFGEPWERKKERVLSNAISFSSSEIAGQVGYSYRHDNSDWPKHDLRCFIVKSNDDLRQEVCCLQVMELCNEIFTDNGLGGQLYLHPYRIISTGADTGLVEVLPDTVITSLHKPFIFHPLTIFYPS